MSVGSRKITFESQEPSELVQLCNIMLVNSGEIDYDLCAPSKFPSFSLGLWREARRLEGLRELRELGMHRQAARLRPAKFVQELHRQIDHPCHASSWHDVS
jgi:hypothetical protein